MTTLDTLPEQFGELVERARTLLHQEISGARATLAKLKLETAEANKALTDLREQCRQAHRRYYR